MSSSSEMSSALQALSNNLAEIVERVDRSVVGINARSRISSSGVHYRSGIVVTAEHTIQREDEITVTLWGDRTVAATLVGRDTSTDLAVLRLPEATIPVAEIGDTSSLKVGHVVLAIARPGESVSASMGVVSAVNGAWRSWCGGLIDQFVRLDLNLYPGFSGGPLVDVWGRVVGINTSGPRNLVLAIPTSTVDRVIDRLLEKGHISRGYLGVSMQPVLLPDTLKAALNLSSSGGVIVVNVEGNGPAERAGMLIGDVMVALDGKPVNDTGDVLAMLGPDRAGTTLAVQLIRGGALVEMSILVGERPRRKD